MNIPDSALRALLEQTRRASISKLEDYDEIRL